VVSIFFEFVRRDAQQLFFDLFNSFARCQPGTIAEPENMGVDGDGRVAKRRVEYDIGGFSSDAGQRFECGAIIGNVAIVQVEQHAAGCDDIFRLGAEQADGLDVFGQSCFAERQHGGRRRSDRVESGGCLVDTDIGCLSRQNDRDQQLKWRCVVQFSGWCRIGITQAGIELLDL